MGKFNKKDYKSCEETNSSVDWQQLISSFKSHSVEDALKATMDKVVIISIKMMLFKNFVLQFKKFSSRSALLRVSSLTRHA